MRQCEVRQSYYKGGELKAPVGMWINTPLPFPATNAAELLPDIFLVNPRVQFPILRIHLTGPQIHVPPAEANKTIVLIGHQAGAYGAF